MHEYLHPLGLDGIARLIAGIILGFGFGFVIVKSDIAWRRTVLNMVMLKDSRFLQIFLLSLGTGVILYQLGNKAGLVKPNFRPVFFWGAAFGGIICGIGITLCRQIPATALASLASGRLFSIWVLAGMLLAFPAAKIVSGWLSNTVYTWAEPFTFHEKVDSYASTWMVAVWTVSICLIFALFLQFSLGKDENDNK